MRKLMIPCPIPVEPFESHGVKVGYKQATQWVPIETCATRNNGKECPFINIPPKNQALSDFDPNNIQPKDYIDSNGIDYVCIGCGYPREIGAVIMEVPDNEKSKIIKVQ